MTDRNQRPRPTPLDRRSGIPLYHQIQQRLLEQIQSGELKPGEPLPSIQQIASQSPICPFTRVSYLEEGTPVEHGKSIYCGDN